MYAHLDSYNSAAGSASVSLSAQQGAMSGPIPMGVRVSIDVFDELWASPDGNGGVFIHHVLLAPGFEHTESLDGD